MCIRDSARAVVALLLTHQDAADLPPEVEIDAVLAAYPDACLLYTSDAADERSSVDLGGRRIIKKKKHRRDTVWSQINIQRTLADDRTVSTKQHQLKRTR